MNETLRRLREADERRAVVTLLHQFSEWLDTYPTEDSDTHDDLVRIFLEARHPGAWPHIS